MENKMEVIWNKLVSSNRWLAMTKQNNFCLQQGELFILYMSIGS